MVLYVRSASRTSVRHPRPSTQELPAHISGLMDLDIQIGDLSKSITFAIVDDPALPLIIGTAYQDKFIESVQSKTPRLKLNDICSVATLETLDSPVCTFDSPDDAQPRKVQIYRRTVIPSMSEVPKKCAPTNPDCDSFRSTKALRARSPPCVPTDSWK